MAFVLHWAATALALVAADWVLEGVHVRSGLVLAAAALVLGLVNALVRPALVVLTLPLTVLTLGLFYVVVNGFAFWLAAAVVPGFSVAGFGAAIGGALVVSIVSWLLGALARGR